MILQKIKPVIDKHNPAFPVKNQHQRHNQYNSRMLPARINLSSRHKVNEGSIDTCLIYLHLVFNQWLYGQPRAEREKSRCQKNELSSIELR